MLDGLQFFATLGDYDNLIDYLVLMHCFEFDTDRSAQQPYVTGRYTPMAYLTHGKLLHGPVRAARVLGVMAAWQDRIIGGKHCPMGCAGHTDLR